MLDDAQLLRRYADRHDEAAFAALVERHVGLVYGAALRQLNGATHRAEDVTQAVFVDLARKARALVGRSDLSGWLYTSTHYAAAKLKRSEQRRQAREQEAQLMQQIDAGGDSDAAAWEQVRPVLDDALLSLPERDREALLLRFFHGRRLAEIGRLLALSEDAARMRVDRALDKLRTALSRRGVTSTAAALALTLNAHASATAPAGLAASVAGVAVAGGTMASAGPVAAVLHFMGTSKMALGGTALLAALAVGTVVQESRAERAAVAAMTGARQEHDVLQARLREQERRTAIAEKALADAQRTRSAAASAEADRIKATIDTVLRESEAFMTKHPEVKQAFIDEHRARAASRYAGLFRELGLSAGQIERFKDLVSTGQIGRRSGANSPLVPYNTGGDKAEAMRELKALLGPEGFARYQFYEKAELAIQRAVQFAGVLAGTATPLTTEQAQRVQTLLMEQRSKIDGTAALRFEWDVILREARTLLSPPQIALLESYQAADAYTDALYEAARKEGKASYSRPGLGP